MKPPTAHIVARMPNATMILRQSLFDIARRLRVTLREWFDAQQTCRHSEILELQGWNQRVNQRAQPQKPQNDLPDTFGHVTNSPEPLNVRGHLQLCSRYALRMPGQRQSR